MENIYGVSQALLVLIPISLIGIWRWSIWLSRRLAATYYFQVIDKPVENYKSKGGSDEKVSVVTPVYNEDINLFFKAVDSWIAGGAAEIIAVIDHSNKRHIIDFERRYGSRDDVDTNLIVTPKPGKRAALADGILQASNEIIALVDSDTLWDKKILKHVLAKFREPSIGGVTTEQRVYKPRTLAQHLFNIMLWSRYNEEIPFMLATGKVVNTLSGRSAFYRKEAIVNERFDNIHQLRHEFFLTSRCISGDDKRLTHLILEQGWHTEYARGAVVYTHGEPKLTTFLKQRVRWTRNSWRADSRAFSRVWVVKHPGLALHNLDRFIQPFVMLIGPIVFITALITGNHILAATLGLWWILSRYVKLFGYFRARSWRQLRYLPAYIVFSYVNAVLKIFALATVVEQGWLTRWDKSRLKAQLRTLRTSLVGGTIALGVAVLTAGGVTWVYGELTRYAGVLEPLNNNALRASSQEQESLISAPSSPRLEEGGEMEASTPDVYVVMPGDTVSEIAGELDVPQDELVERNELNNPNIIVVGQQLRYEQSGL